MRKSPEERAALQLELDALNRAVDDAVDKRTAWMDAHMTDWADADVGDEISDSNGRVLGVVTRLYRYWGPQSHSGGKCRDPQYDTHMSIEYEFKRDLHSNFTDNTSSRCMVVHKRRPHEF